MFDQNGPVGSTIKATFFMVLLLSSLHTWQPLAQAASRFPCQAPLAGNTLWGFPASDEVMLQYQVPYDVHEASGTCASNRCTDHNGAKWSRR